ncbi:MAG: class II fumarate hydratase [Deltaproteobacteria bacterium]|nr:class II fumarate hydratase [Deltaproteobacteria bacterium]
MTFREESDSMGKVRVPETAYYGPSTQRAVDNFHISGICMPISLIRALGLIKKCCAEVNAELGLLDLGLAEAIGESAQEVMDGKLDSSFVVDVFQTGSGTSTHMNINEVIASRANEMLTGKRGGKIPIHPNDHVNLGQSSNDVFPTAMNISALMEISLRLIPALELLMAALSRKAHEFKDILKMGRTHLQDAVPMTLGQEFSGFERQVELGIRRIASVKNSLCELALGGTAVGTGLNAHPGFAGRVISRIAEATHLPFIEAKNHFEAQSARDAAVETSGALKTISVSLIKIANDIRWLASGPRCGLGEIHLPELQPGSSIMPGKINPVIPEVVVQVAVQVIGYDVTITLFGQGGHFQLNVMMPVMAYNLLQSISLLSASTVVFAEKCIDGIHPNPSVCRANVDKSLYMATILAPIIGYDKAAEIAKKAYETGKSIREVAEREPDLPEIPWDQL